MELTIICEHIPDPVKSPMVHADAHDGGSVDTTTGRQGMDLERYTLIVSYDKIDYPPGPFPALTTCSTNAGNPLHA